MGLGVSASAVCGYLMMSLPTIGYAAVWVNGSVFYTWTFTCGIWALTAVADVVFAPVERGERLGVSAEGCRWQKFLLTIPCAVIASMSIEQIAAVLLTFEVLAVLYLLIWKRRLHPLLTVQTVATLLGFVVLFAAPGNELRVASETESWMPWFDALPTGRHLLLTANWLLSSFANANRLFLCGVWAVCMLLLLQKERRSLADRVSLAAAGILFLVALLPCAGITFFSDMGVQYIPTNVRLEQPPVIELYDGRMWFAMAWWCAALLFTLVLILRVTGGRVVPALVYLAGIASEAILYFSPTIYASGDRLYYLTDLLLLFLILYLAFGVKGKTWRSVTYGWIILLGAGNAVCQMALFFNLL